MNIWLYAVAPVLGLILFWLSLHHVQEALKAEIRKEFNALADVKLKILQVACKTSFEQGIAVGEKRAALRAKPQ